jgi:hypothetical protein
MSSPIVAQYVPMGSISHQTGLPQTNDNNFPDKNAQQSGILTGESLKELLARLRSKHPLYEKYEALWQTYLDTFEGGPSMIKPTYLHKHMREADEDFDARVKRAHYTNYCEPLTTFFTDFIFTETIHRGGGSKADWFTEFITDVNRKGDDITAFMGEGVCNDFQILGMVYGLVDAPPKPDGIEVVTKADEQAFKLKPYWVLVRATEVLDWGADEFGKYVYWKRRQFVTDTDPLGRKIDIERYTEWTPTLITITDVTKIQNVEKATQTQRVNGLGKVPVVVARYRTSKEDPEMGLSFLRDLASDNVAVLNLTSLLDEFLYKQCFNLLAMEMSSELPRADQEDGAMGTSNVLTYPPGMKAPAYITPSSEPAAKIQDERRTIVAEMYRRAAQDTVNELFNGGGSSGFSKAQSFRTTVPRIANRAEVLERFEIQMFQLTYEYMGEEWDGKIAYKDHYEITNLSDALAQMQTLFSQLLIPSATFAKEEMLRMISLFDGKIAAPELKTIRAEIESADWDEWQDTMKLHFLGRAATSPDIGTALGQPPVPVPGTSSEMATAGKDTATAPSTATKPTLTATQAAKTSAK